MKSRKPIRSQMGWSTADKIVVRGHDLPNELLGRIDLGGMAFLEIMGRRPTVQEAEVFNALLVTLVENTLGNRPSPSAGSLPSRPRKYPRRPGWG